MKFSILIGKIMLIIQQFLVEHRLIKRMHQIMIDLLIFGLLPTNPALIRILKAVQAL
jgi:hypothetical protein